VSRICATHASEILTTNSFVVLRRLWSFVEGKFVARKAQQHKDHPIPARPTVTTEDVTVIIPTIDTPSTFPLAMSSVLKNKPLEVIIVTIERDYARVTELLSQVALDDDSRDIPIQVFTVELPPGKRKQMAAAIPKARGKITAQADDDVVWGPTLLQHLVAPFEDPKVGCSSGFQAAYIPPERRNTKVVTGWEIAAWYSLRGRGPALLGQHAVDGGIMCADGRTVLYRTAILQDKAFLRAFMNDRFRGRFMDSGEDIWVTRWLDVQGWKHGLQAAPEAAILSNVEETSKYVSQRVRWERSTIRTCLQFVCEPGLWR
jgi:cellulose synthase/poly-beta-1,6-N-acetylglucosamine synthase-like glycosyltransferase